MDVLSLGSSYQEQEEDARIHGVQAEPDMDLFEGAGEAVGLGLLRGSVKLSRGAAMAGAVLPIAYDSVFSDDTEAQDWYFKNVIDDKFNRTVDMLTPNAEDMGTAANVLGGLAEMLPQLAGGGASLVGSMQMNTGIDMVRQGVDSTTAQVVGAVSGVATGVGVALPMIGKTLTQKVLGNAALNPLVGMVQRGITGEVLESKGYDALADQQKVFDAEAVALDVLSGAVFGAVDFKMGGKAQTMDDFVGISKAKDAVSTLVNYRHKAVDSAPGIPADNATMVRHIEAIDDATDALLKGNPVDVSGRFDKDATFIQRPQAEPLNIDSVFDDVIDDLPLRADELEPRQMPEAATPKDVEPAKAVEPAGAVDDDLAQVELAIKDIGDFDVRTGDNINEITGAVEGGKYAKASDLLTTIKAQFDDAAKMSEAILEAARCALR